MKNLILSKLRLVKMNHELNPDADESESGTLLMKIENESSKVSFEEDGSSYDGIYSLAKIYLHAKDEDDQTVFKTECDYDLFLEIIDQAEVDKLSEGELSDVSIELGYPYIREDVNSMLSRSGFRQIQLPLQLTDEQLRTSR